MSGIAAELAGLPGVAQRLLAVHVPDERGRCRGCTSPGTGLPSGSWPCALHFYATAAVQLRTHPGRGLDGHLDAAQGAR